MYCYRLVCASLLTLLFFSFPAYSDSEYLSIRPLPDHTFEAVLSLNTRQCITVKPVESVEVVDSEILVESTPFEPLPCVGLLRGTTVDYEVTAYIGELAPGQYTVTWNQTGSFTMSASVTVSELQGPYVPCVGCDDLVHAPFPETGSWYNPAQSGSGLNFEIQNGVLAGFYYGYDDTGLPEWQLITGPLVRSEKQGVQWELKTQFQQFQDGNCIDCEYVPPTGPADGPTITLDFMQRNYMRITIGDNPSQFFVPIIYGSMGMKYFEEQTPYVFPEYGGDFVLIMKPNTDPPSNWLWEHRMVFIGKGSVHTGGADQGKLIYRAAFYEPPPGPDVLFDIITCELEPESNQPGCIISFYGGDYVMPIGNMSDSRFFGEADDGSTIEGYRFNYD